MTVEWYKDVHVQYALLQGVQRREIFLKDATEDKFHLRPLNLFSVQGINYAVERFQFHKRKYHFFHSIATLDHTKLPHTPTDLTALADVRAEFNDKFQAAMVGYDYALDIDNDLVSWKNKDWQRPKLLKHFREKHGLTGEQAKKDLEVMLESGEATADFHKSIAASAKTADKIFKEFSYLSLPFYCTFSGSKGFHFRIEWTDIKKVAPKLLPLEFVEVSKKITDTLVSKLKLENIDASIYDDRRVLRVPYSLHPKTGLVCLPLDYPQLANFQPELCHPEHWGGRLYNGTTNRGYLKQPFDDIALRTFLERFF